MTHKPCSEAAARNGRAILEILDIELEKNVNILEIGSGTGQHAAQFAAALPHIIWQTSDLDENHAAINAWVDDSAQSNLHPPLSLDVLSAKLPAASYDAVFSANTAHIMSMNAVRKMFELVATVLRRDGTFCLYGPFRQGGDFNAPSNADFHRQLRSRDEAMGIRHIESLDDEASLNRLARKRLYAMPANNYLAIWQKEIR